MSSALHVALALLVGPIATPPAQDGDVGVQAEIQSLAAELAAVGVELDLGALKTVVRPRAACVEDAAREIETYLGAEGLETRRQTLLALGAQPGEDGAALLEQLVRGRLEVLAAYYQPERDELVLVEETVGELAERELELAQALAVAARDQRSDLGSLYTDPAATLEERVVRLALAHGEALNAVAEVFAARALDDSVEGSPEHVDWLVRQVGLARLDAEAWVHGRDLIAHTLLAEDGPARVEGLWSAAPSSEQLMHRPKRGNDEPAVVVLPDWPEKAGGAELVHEDTLGELAIYALLLDADSPRARAWVAALGWDGDLLRRYQTDEGEHVLVWRTVWDRPKDAQQFAKEWDALTSGHVRLGGRVVDWVVSDTRGIWNKWLKTLEATPAASAAERADAQSTERIEAQHKANKRNRSYIVANEWRFPKYELTVEVPIGWYEDERDGFKYLVREKTAGYRDNLYVLANPNGAGQTVEDLLDINRRRIEAEDYDLEVAEVRQVDGHAMAFLRYRGHIGDHEVVHTSGAFVQGDRQIALTMSIEEMRWVKSAALVDYLFGQIRFGPVPFADAE
jgi:hypothetical protein